MENFIAVSNGELAGNPKVGKTFLCPRCNVAHAVEHGETVNKDGTRSPSKLLAFYQCGEKSYLGGFHGREIKF